MGRTDAFDMETLAELPQWTDKQIDFDFALLPVQIDVFFPLHVLSFWHDLKAKSPQGGSDGFHAVEIAEQVSADEKIKVVGGPRHGQLREERPLARLVEPHAIEVETEAAADGKRDRVLAQLVEQVEQVGRERVHPCHVGLSSLLEGLQDRLAQLRGGFLLSLVAVHQLQKRLHRGCSEVSTCIEVNKVLIGLQELDVGKPRRFFKVGTELLEEPFQVGAVEGLDRFAGHHRILADG
jgi:hypothetical protein